MALNGAFRVAVVGGVFCAVLAGAGVATAAPTPAPSGGASGGGGSSNEVPPPAIANNGDGTVTVSGSGYTPGTPITVSVSDSCGNSKTYSTVANSAGEYT